jgi:hypothetical protein
MSLGSDGEPRDAVGGESAPIEDSVPDPDEIPDRGRFGCLVGVLVLLLAGVGIPLFLTWVGDAVNNSLHPPVTYAESCLDPYGGPAPQRSGVLTLVIPASPGAGSADAFDVSAPDSEFSYFWGRLESWGCGFATVSGADSRAGCEQALATSHTGEVVPKVGGWYCTAAENQQPVLLQVTAIGASSIRFEYTEWW